MTAEPELRRLDRVDSTQDVAHALAAAGAPGGTAVVAEEQTAGRGSRRRAWSSPRGGLWVSVLLRPASGAGIELLSLRAGRAVAEAIEAATGVGPLRLKWPNDLMLGQAKLGGVLCEARWQGDRLGWIAVGVGVNVANALPPDARLGATRLADHGVHVEAAALAPVVVARLRQVDVESGALAAEEHVAFAARDWLAGRRLAEPVRGCAEGIAPDGALRVRRDDGSLAMVRAGSVMLEEQDRAG